MAGDSNSHDKELSAIAPSELRPDGKHEDRESGLIAARYEGPIPPPEILAALERVQPGLANRVISMAENEQEHTSYIERKAVDTHSLQVKWGNANTLVALLGCAVLSPFAPIGAITLGVLVALGTIASIFTKPRTPGGS